MNSKTFLLLFIFFIIIAATLYSQKDQLINRSSQSSNQDPEADITSQIKACGHNSGYTKCLQQVAATFLKKYPLSKIFEVFESSEADADFFAYCHTTLHFLGRELYNQKKDTKDALSLCGSTCFQGCQHGVLEGYLTEKGVSYDNDTALRDEIIKICGQRETYEKKELYNECLHGLGHALMFVTDGELPRSLKLCDALGDKERRDWCYSGVFMENSTSSTNKDHPSKYLKTDDPLYPCNILERQYLTSCYTLQGFYFAQLSGHDVKKTTALCYTVPTEYRINCFRAIGQTKVGNVQDLNKLKQSCEMIEEKEYTQACIQGVVGALSTRYSGDGKLIIEFCTLVDKDNKQSCYNSMKDYLRGWMTDPSKELRSICLDIPEEEYKNECLQD